MSDNGSDAIPTPVQFVERAEVLESAIRKALVILHEYGALSVDAVIRELEAVLPKGKVGP